MKAFSESNSFYNTMNAHIAFINVNGYLSDLFSQHTIKLFTENGDAMHELSTKGFDRLHFNPLLMAEDDLLDGNLRMIESYMPEILFVLSSKPNLPLSKSILNFAKSGFPYTDSKHARIYLEHKIVRFFEALLFANLFDGVWNGEVISHRHYVYKQADELEYYNICNLRTLVLKLAPKIALSNTHSFANGVHNYELKFRFL